MGQVSLDRDNPVFFDNNAHLGIVRADWRFMDGFEASGELRLLELPGPERPARRRADRRLQVRGRAHEDRRRVQLHRLLGRPDGPELQPPRVLPQLQHQHVVGCIEVRRRLGAVGFEPTTFCSQSRCATKLRYAPVTRGRLPNPLRVRVWLRRLVSTGARPPDRRRWPGPHERAWCLSAQADDLLGDHGRVGVQQVDPRRLHEVDRGARSSTALRANSMCEPMATAEASAEADADAPDGRRRGLHRERLAVDHAVVEQVLRRPGSTRSDDLVLEDTPRTG